MTDLLHDHLTIGFSEGCNACRQMIEDFVHANLVDRGWNPPVDWSRGTEEVA